MTKRVTGRVTRRVTTRRVKITWRVYKERYLAGYCSGKHSYKKKHDALVQCYKRKGIYTLAFFLLRFRFLKRDCSGILPEIA